MQAGWGGGAESPGSSAGGLHRAHLAQVKLQTLRQFLRLCRKGQCLQRAQSPQALVTALGSPWAAAPGSRHSRCLQTHSLSGWFVGSHFLDVSIMALRCQALFPAGWWSPPGKLLS